MPDLVQDKRFFEAGISVLPDYLLCKEMFFPLGGNLPRLTIGNLLLANLRLRAIDDQTGDSQVNSIRTKWRVAWEQKSAREIHVRLNLWKNFLGEYRNSKEGNADRFPIEVRHRAIIHLLSKETDKTPELDQLPQLDQMLMGSLTPGSYVWEKQVEPEFPQPEYWFLYGKLKLK